MNNSHYSFAKPVNEPIFSYAPGTEGRQKLKEALNELKNEEWEIPLIIGGKEIHTGDTGSVVMPHNHHHKLGTYHKASEKHVQEAIKAAQKAKADC